MYEALKNVMGEENATQIDKILDAFGAIDIHSKLTILYTLIDTTIEILGTTRAEWIEQYKLMSGDVDEMLGERL